MNFDKNQLEAMRIVYSDLDFLRVNWGENIDDDSLRRNAGIVRQLLLDEGGLLLKVSEWLGHTIYVQAPPSPLLRENLDRITFYSAGGVTYKGATLQSTIVKNYAMSPEEIKRSYKEEKNNRVVKMSIANFLDIPALIINGETFSRTEIIKYIANKKGGTHYELNERKMARMRHLEEAKDDYSMLDKNAPFFEFLSIGQIIVKSKYTDKLKKKIKKILNQSNIQIKL